MVGLVAFIAGCVFLHNTVSTKEDRIYTTAVIVDIDSHYSSATEDVSYIVYVSHEYGDQLVIGQLNSWDSTMHIGKELDVYFYEDDIHFLYEKGSEFIAAIVLMILGVAFITTSIFMIKGNGYNSKNGAVTVIEYDY